MINFDRKHGHASDILLALPTFQLHVYIDVCVWKCVLGVVEPIFLALPKQRRERVGERSGGSEIKARPT